MKRGRLSRGEQDYIEKNSKIMTVEEIAKGINRDTESVINHQKKVGLSSNKQDSFRVQAEYDLKKKPYWRELKSQFTEEELELLLFHWKQVIAQFRNDVLATEEIQILDMVKLEVLMNRALTEEHQTLLLLKRYENMIADESAKPSDQQDKSVMFETNRMIVSLRGAKQSLSANYKELHKSKSELFKNLKATREQRIQKLEGNKTTFAGMLTKLLSDPDFFEETGLYMEKMRFAAEGEKARLAEYHKYEDGMIDRPLLSADTVGEEG